MVCAFTGHRPQRLPWGSNEEDPRCLALKQILRRRLDEALDMGCRTFLCGMARGCDTYFAEAVLERREAYPHLRLIAMIPWAGQAEGWREADRLRYKRLCDACDEREVLEPYYTTGSALRRNKVMVSRARVLISVYDGGTGGTANTVRHAERMGLTILPVWV